MRARAVAGPTEQFAGGRPAEEFPGGVRERAQTSASGPATSV